MNAQIQERMDAAVAEAAAKKYPPRIRPNYIGDEFVGFRIEVFNPHSIRYQAVGVNFTSYKAAFLSLRAIQSGNLPLEGCVTPRTDHPDLFPKRAIPSINWFRVLVTLGCIVCIVALFSGCSTVRPLSEYQHISHAADGIGGTGFDTLSLGIRWRPMEGVTVDLLEGYSPNKLNDRHEVFTGRVTVEF